MARQLPGRKPVSYKHQGVVQLHYGLQRKVLMIGKAIHKAFAIAKTRNWEKIFVAVDIHDTAVVSNYSGNRIPTMFYPNAKEVLQYLSKQLQNEPDVYFEPINYSVPINKVLQKAFSENR